MHAPPAPHVPSERVGELVLSILACWTGSVEDGERALAPLRALATPIADTVAPIPYPQIYESRRTRRPDTAGRSGRCSRTS